jgi:ABC-2 type transport system permease protein
MRLAWAFFCRDAAIALSYRVAFVVQLLGNFLLVGILYYLSQTIGVEKIPSLERYGGNLLAFLLIGVALTDCVLVSLVGFAQQVRESQTTGTLEATLMSPVRLTLILICSSYWNYFLSAVRFLMYLAAGLAIGGLKLDRINPLSALTIFVLTVLSFMGIGILWAGIVLLVKRGEALMTLLSVLVLLVSGVLFPVNLLPNWVQWFSGLIPLTVALEGMRLAIIKGATLAELSSVVGRMTIFAALLLFLGIQGFNYAVKIGRRQGSLTQY